MESAKLAIDFDIEPHGAVTLAGIPVAMLPAGARIGLAEATKLLVASVQTKRTLTIEDSAAVLANSL